ncbi:4-carboxymuconolactone decarboxylase [Nocardia sp. NPDC051570]|uniref:bifunctional 3-oxoadipate enol-lactonase/4-carboxymuconolactone decarboxylase PcaDC n=1 Tax=Nocardia sp. NPDC051570 TaxID=3364324 RepID=UPI00378FA5AA
MSVPFTLSISRFRAPEPELPLLVLGPSLGTTHAVWEDIAPALAHKFDVIAFDLPGHGRSARADTAFDLAALGRAVLAAVDYEQALRSDPGTRFAYAGVSLGGAIGLQLLLDCPARISRAAVVCGAAKFSEPEMWHARARLVRSGGTAAVVETARDLWFASGFTDLQPDIAGRLLDSLRGVDAESYALCCEALAAFDVRDQLSRIRTPTLVVSGGADVATPAAQGAEIALGVARGRRVVLDHVAHLAPIESPQRVLAELLTFFTRDAVTLESLYDSGMAVRREVLGDAHVDRAVDEIDDTTRDFQELITRYAWGTIWTRPGLDRHIRSVVTITALVAHGHWEELDMHLRAAVRNGLSRDEIVEVLLQTAIYCSVPAANSAFRVAQRVFKSLDETS